MSVDDWFVKVSMGMLASTLLLSACQTTDDPREGGFVGGVGGLSSGAYEQRIQEREESLNRLEGIQDELEIQRAELENSQQQSLSTYQMEQQRVADLSSDTRTLAARLKTLNTRHEEQELSRKDLISRLEDLQGDIDYLATKDEANLRVEDLEKERGSLEEEYRLLLDIYREISQ